jgi:adenine deaminase
VIAFNRTHLGSTARRTYCVKEFNVGLVVISPLSRKVIFVVDSFYRTDWLTCTTVNALIRVNVKHAVTFIDAVNWALSNTCFVFDINTR